MKGSTGWSSRQVCKCAFITCAICDSMQTNVCLKLLRLKCKCLFRLHQKQFRPLLFSLQIHKLKQIPFIKQLSGPENTPRSSAVIERTSLIPPSSAIGVNFIVWVVELYSVYGDRHRHSLCRMDRCLPARVSAIALSSLSFNRITFYLPVHKDPRRCIDSVLALQIHLVLVHVAERKFRILQYYRPGNLV
jgi:hypothetical protein